jgi:hypothetical protein
MSGSSARPTSYPYQNERIWSSVEKTIARRVFDAALKRELQQIMQEAKQKADRIKEPADVWELEHYLTRRRKDVDRKYEFRTSALTRVFGTLLFESRIGEEDLRGLGEDKKEVIRSCARVLSADVA